MHRSVGGERAKKGLASLHNPQHAASRTLSYLVGLAQMYLVYYGSFATLFGLLRLTFRYNQLVLNNSVGVTSISMCLQYLCIIYQVCNHKGLDLQYCRALDQGLHSTNIASKNKSVLTPNIYDNIVQKPKKKKWLYSQGIWKLKFPFDGIVVHPKS